MIFQKEHIKQIKNGIKTQTRRINRGIYQIGKDYAVQPCRTCSGIKGMRIVIDEIRLEDCSCLHYQNGVFIGSGQIWISNEDAKAEGNYTPEEFEKKFRELNPKWDGVSRWVFVFHLGERINNIKVCEWCNHKNINPEKYGKVAGGIMLYYCANCKKPMKGEGIEDYGNFKKEDLISYDRVFEGIGGD